MENREYFENSEDEETGDVMIEEQEVGEVIDDAALNQEEPMDDDEAMDDYDENGNIEIDMSNNSQGYFEDHEDSIFAVATHPSLPLVCTGGGDNAAYLWVCHKPGQAQLLSKLVGYEESVAAVAFTFDGSFLLTGDMNGRVIVYKSEKKGQSWTPFDRMLEDVNEVIWIKQHPRQNIFAVGGADGTVVVYQIGETTLDMIFSGYSHSKECNNGEFVQVDDANVLKLVTVSEDGSIIGWNCYTQQQEFKFDANNLKGLSPPWVSICVNPTSKIIVVGSRDSQVVVINTESGALLTSFTAMELKENDNIYDVSIESLTWCDQLNLLALGLVSGDVFIFDTNTWKVRRALKCGDAITKLTFIESTPILLGSSMDGKVYKWDARTGELLYTCVGHHMGVLDFAIDSSKERLITAGDDGVALVYKF